MNPSFLQIPESLLDEADRKDPFLKITRDLHLNHAAFTQAQIASCIRQAFECGDFTLYMQLVPNSSAVVYTPAAQVSMLRRKIADLERMREWRPIATAPRDGTWFLAWFPEIAMIRPMQITAMSFHIGQTGMPISMWDRMKYTPTKWTHMPAAPEGED